MRKNKPVKRGLFYSSILPDGKPFAISPHMAKKQGIKTQERVDAILRAHVSKWYVFKDMIDTDDPKTLKELAAEVTQLEFRLQRLWGFPEDKTRHAWFAVPKCACPKLDNLERQGTPYGVISSVCPIHGEEPVVITPWDKVRNFVKKLFKNG